MQTYQCPNCGWTIGRADALCTSSKCYPRYPVPVTMETAKYYTSNWQWIILALATMKARRAVHDRHPEKG